MFTAKKTAINKLHIKSTMGKVNEKGAKKKSVFNFHVPRWLTNVTLENKWNKTSQFRNCKQPLLDLADFISQRKATRR